MKYLEILKISLALKSKIAILFKLKRWRMKERKFERGQAITEMAIGLVAIMAVFLGLLFVAALGLENIKSVMAARSGADSNAAGGIQSGESGSAIVEWSSGNDGLYFTSDDKAVTGTGENTTDFSSQLQTAYSDASFDLTETVTVGGNSYSSAFSNLADSSLFLYSAQLTGYLSSNEDPLASRKLDDLKQAFASLLGKQAEFSINERVYMPLVTE